MFPSALKLCMPCRQNRHLARLSSLRKCTFSSSSNLVPHCNLPSHSVQTSHLMRQCKLPLIPVPMSSQVLRTSCRLFHVTPHPSCAASDRHGSRNEQLLTQMNIRLVNENSFLSWCRNAYLSTVVGVAMMAEGASALAQSAGLGALLVGTMNLAWGTGCHVTNLVRLRHVSGMSRATLFLHLAGSSLHCVLWAFVLICYIGFLDESRWPADEEELQFARDGGRKSRGPDGLRRV